MKRLLIPIGLLLVTAECVKAETINADDCSSSSVQSAIDDARSGDTVFVVSPGSSTWTSGVLISSSKGITLDLNGCTITLSGASGSFTIQSGVSTLNRVTSGTFIKARGTGYKNYAGPFRIEDSRSGFGVRVDNIVFTGSGSSTGAQNVYIDAGGQGPGLLDNNIFEGMGTSQEFIHFNGWGSGNESGWTQDSNVELAGAASLFYVENNVFRSARNGVNVRPVIQGYYGTRLVYRYNTFDFAAIDAHGTAGSIGQRWYEVYENTFLNTTNNTNQNTSVNIRAGTGVIFNNTVDWGGISLCEEDSGYPADYQVGRDINNAADATYVWNNSRSEGINSCDAPEQAGMLQYGRDVIRSPRPGYTPYTYPHPFTRDVDDVASMAPSNLEVVQ